MAKMRETVGQQRQGRSNGATRSTADRRPVGEYPSLASEAAIPPTWLQTTGQRSQSTRRNPVDSAERRSLAGFARRVSVTGNVVGGGFARRPRAAALPAALENRAHLRLARQLSPTGRSLRSARLKVVGVGGVSDNRTAEGLTLPQNSCIVSEASAETTPGAVRNSILRPEDCHSRFETTQLPKAVFGANHIPVWKRGRVRVDGDSVVLAGCSRPNIAGAALSSTSVSERANPMLQLSRNRAGIGHPEMPAMSHGNRGRTGPAPWPSFEILQWRPLRSMPF